MYVHGITFAIPSLRFRARFSLRGSKKLVRVLITAGKNKRLGLASLDEEALQFLIAVSCAVLCSALDQ